MTEVGGVVNALVALSMKSDGSTGTNAAWVRILDVCMVYVVTMTKAAVAALPSAAGRTPQPSAASTSLPMSPAGHTGAGAGVVVAGAAGGVAAPATPHVGLPLSAPTGSVAVLSPFKA